MSYRLPLVGIRVLEFCWVLAGPLVTRCLATFGAEVLKVESAEKVDAGRVLPPWVKGTDMSAHFLDANCDKLGITLNMRQPKAREIARKLAGMCDVVINNMASNALEKWGLGYEDLTKIRPGIIVVDMPVMGRTGPYAGYGAYGHGLQAMAGVTYLTGFPDRTPSSCNIAFPDYAPVPMQAVVAILAALHHRNRTGEGQFIQLNQYEATTAYGGIPILDHLVNGRVGTRNGNRIPNASPHGAYRCKGDDRWCVIGVFTDEEWQALCQVMERPAWMAEPRFASIAGRKEHEDELDYLIQAWTINKTAEEVMLSLQQAGVAAGVVQNGQDIVERDPQIKEREYFVILEHPEVGKVICEGTAIKFSSSPGRVSKPGPDLGQHNEYVFKELLGMNEEEINQCYVDGVFT